MFHRALKVSELKLLHNLCKSLDVLEEFTTLVTYLEKGFEVFTVGGVFFAKSSTLEEGAVISVDYGFLSIKGSLYYIFESDSNV